MLGVEQPSFSFPPGGATPRAEATDEREGTLPNVGTWTFEEGEASMRVAIVHSGFGGAAKSAQVFPMACRHAGRRAVCSLLGRSSLYRALVG